MMRIRTREREGGGRKTEDGGQRTEGGGRRTEDGAPVCDRLRAEQRAEDGGRKTEDGAPVCDRLTLHTVFGDKKQGLTRRRGDAEMNQNIISDQFWGEPEEGRNGVVNGLPEQNLCVFASWREDKTSDNGESRKDAKTLR